ncbi:MAG: helix-turn-helix transcriptional regulator [Bacteroidota bacterium]|nr:helix-turn-helix transcriptional regulator [Bacteroidota bacterium]
MLNTFIIAGVIQAFLLGTFFIFHRTEINLPAHRILGIFFWLLSINLFAASFFVSGKSYPYSWLIRIPEIMPFLYPPLIYGFTFSIIYQTTFSTKYWTILIAPFFAGLFILLPFYLQSPEEKIKVYQLMVKGIYPFSFYVLFIGKVIYGALMIGISYYTIIKYRRIIKSIFSTLKEKDLRWLEYVLACLLLVWLVTTLRFFFLHSNISVYMPATFITVFIYVLSYFTLSQKILLDTGDLELLGQINTDKNSTNEKNDISASQTQIDKKEAEEKYKRFFETTVSSKAYLDKEFTLGKMATLSGIRANTISEILNKYYSINFYDFINKLRAEEVKESLESGKYQYLTIDALAQQCGFKSKSTFYQSFKSLTGKTPAQFKKDLKNS